MPNNWHYNRKQEHTIQYSFNIIKANKNKNKNKNKNINENRTEQKSF